jgi:hypothetical protein
MDIEALKDRIENLLFQYWNEMPNEKPRYTLWFYSKGGVKEKTDDLLSALQHQFPASVRE